ncbi:MAG: hypothetical protein RMJ84_04825 [Sandaracinaceae bacterium]|nr:hypothetical protein [Sandaracinaceae bacterium]
MSTCSNWAWRVNQCTGPEDPCADAIDCATCTARPSCGFCDGRCQRGTAMGPSSGSCMGRWVWTASECASASDCSRQTDCASCTGSPQCGWCAESGRCTEGTASGPSSGSCTRWNWLPAQCGGDDPCARWMGCRACTSQPQCGFCHSDGRCRQGSASGPATGTCADWDFTPADCPCTPLRGACRENAECCAGLSCRSGVSFGMRCCAEANQSCREGADCCGYMDCIGGRCACRASGRGCLDDRDCCSRMCRMGRCA